MADVLAWLNSNQTILTILLGTALLLIVFFVGFAIIALYQGRSITFWPPQIGAKPLLDEKKRDEEQLSQDTPTTISTSKTEISPDAVGESRFECKWASQSPIAKQVLKDTKKLALIVGTSLHRIVYGDLFEYRDWLKRDPTRYIVLIFLNPHSPHAVGRRRTDVCRSSDEQIIEAVRVARDTSSQSPRLMIAVHDGPFRYSARATDIGFPRAKKGSKIQIISSSHLRGISNGFEINLTPGSGKPYQYYEKEILEIWKQSAANIPGHGISIIAKPASLARDSLNEVSLEVIHGLGGGGIELYEYSPEQHHLTLSSLCRTQLDIVGAPLEISKHDNDNSLPLYFGDFLSAVYTKAEEIFNDSTTIVFDQIELDKEGYYSLATSNTDSCPKVLMRFPQIIQDVVEDFASKYPNDKWRTLGKQREGFRYGPKSSVFRPHITLGMAFKKNDSLPLPIKGVKTSLALPKPFPVSLKTWAIGHYAYRSYLRTVGEFPLGLQEANGPSEILFSLGIGIDHSA